MPEDTNHWSTLVGQFISHASLAVLHVGLPTNTAHVETNTTICNAVNESWHCFTWVCPAAPSQLAATKETTHGMQGNIRLACHAGKEDPHGQHLVHASARRHLRAPQPPPEDRGPVGLHGLPARRGGCPDQARAPAARARVDDRRPPPHAHMAKAVQPGARGDVARRGGWRPRLRPPRASQPPPPHRSLLRDWPGLPHARHNRDRRPGMLPRPITSCLYEARAARCGGAPRAACAMGKPCEAKQPLDSYVAIS